MVRFSITRSNDDLIAYKGKKYRLTLYFDRVIEARRLVAESTLNTADSIRAALFMLCSGCERLGNADCSELLIKIFSEYINGDEDPSEGEHEPLFDFEQDAEYIFSSFVMDYGIDLKKECGKLLWCDFIALFKGLSEKTKMREVISIRARKIPAPTKYNCEEIQSITELKRFYALKRTAAQKKNSFNSDLAGLAETLKQRAVVMNGRG